MELTFILLAARQLDLCPFDVFRVLHFETKTATCTFRLHLLRLWTKALSTFSTAEGDIVYQELTWYRCLALS
jgi:hypothetical protein